MRRPLVAGNWKMNPATRREAADLARSVAERTTQADARVVVCPPAIWLSDVSAALAESAVEVGAQSMRAEERGAFTGDTSPLMLEGIARFAIIGHSERRQYACETDEQVAAAVASAVAHGIRPIAAVGERAEERRDGRTREVIERQVRAALSGLDRLRGSGLVVAYEPVWAIGTGDAAAPSDAQEVAVLIRTLLAGKDADGAAEVEILYGGSVTADNAGTFFAEEDIDGALVGGASLDPDAFAVIVRAASDSRT